MLLGLDISYEDFVEQACLQAQQRGDPVFAILPNEAIPADVRERFRRPVRQVLRAAYGQKRAGHDYEGYADETFAQASMLRAQALMWINSNDIDMQDFPLLVLSN